MIHFICDFHKFNKNINDFSHEENLIPKIPLTHNLKINVMKKLILFLFLSSLTISCSDEDTKEENVLVGKWKLSHTNSFGGNFYKLSTNQNVVYHFKENQNLSIESNILKILALTNSPKTL